MDQKEGLRSCRRPPMAPITACRPRLRLAEIRQLIKNTTPPDRRAQWSISLSDQPPLNGPGGILTINYLSATYPPRRTVPRTPYKVRPATVRPVTAPMGKGPYWWPVPRGTVRLCPWAKGFCNGRTVQPYRVVRFLGEPKKLFWAVPRCGTGCKPQNIRKASHFPPHFA